MPPTVSLAHGQLASQMQAAEQGRADPLTRVQQTHAQKEKYRARLSPEEIDAERPVIRAEDVDFVFGSELGVHALTFYVPTGVIFGLVGPSGCGKTTTVRLLNGLYTPARGSLEVFGEQPSRFSRRARENIGYVAQHVTLYPSLSAQENLNFVASLYGLGGFARVGRTKALLKFVELYDARNRSASRLSGGMQRRLQLACALAHNPPLIFADEPTAGTDPILRARFWEHFRALRDEGHTLFVTTQIIGEAEHCDIVGVMRDGRLVFVDTPDGLRRDAFGGDVIRLAVNPATALQAVQLLQNEPAVRDARPSLSQPGLLFVSTEEAATAMPALLAALHAQQIEVQQADQYVPPFEDVFAELLRQAETSTQDETP